MGIPVNRVTTADSDTRAERDMKLNMQSDYSNCKPQGSNHWKLLRECSYDHIAFECREEEYHMSSSCCDYAGCCEPQERACNS